MQLISRQEAANIMGCSRQTISNYVNSGVLKGHMKNGRLFVDAGTVREITDTYKDTCDAVKYFEEENSKMHNLVTDARKALGIFERNLEGYLRSEVVFSIVKSYSDLMTERELGILSMLIRDRMNINSIAEATGLTRERIARMIRKTVRKMRRISYSSMKPQINHLCHEKYVLMEKAKAAMEENEILASTVKDMNTLNSILKNRCNILDDVLIDVNTHIKDCGLSIRAVNVLGSIDVYTVKDLMNTEEKTLPRVRNCGKKTFMEIIDFTERNNIKMIK